MSSNLSAFGLPERLRCSLGIRRAVEGAASVEAAARGLCRFLYDELVDSGGERACALVRFYLTQPFGQLDDDLQRFAQSVAGGHRLTSETSCLTLLGTAGAEPRWNSRSTSGGHRAIPLLSAEMVEKAPMIAQLIKAFGLRVLDVVDRSDSIVRDLGGKSYGVFYVPDALGSAYIPAQSEFVIPYAIKSVIGSGGSLPSGELFAMVLFTRIHVTVEAAERFRALALDAKAALMGFTPAEVFDAPPRDGVVAAAF